MSAGIGAAAALAQELAAENIEFVRDNWYGAPAAMFIGSMLVKNEKIATALSVLAGASAVFNYKLKEFNEGRSTKSPVPLFKPDAKEGVKGLRDAGLRREPAGAAQTSDDDAALLFN